MDLDGLTAIGHDIVDIQRFGRILARRGPAFEARIFTPHEWATADSRRDRVAVLAARFAAKEAVFKALGTGWGAGLKWREVEVMGGGRSAPTLALHGEALALAASRGLRFQVTLSHTDRMASAIVVGTQARGPRS